MLAPPLYNIVANGRRCASASGSSWLVEDRDVRSKNCRWFADTEQRLRAPNPVVERAINKFGSGHPSDQPSRLHGVSAVGTTPRDGRYHCRGVDHLMCRGTAKFLIFVGIRATTSPAFQAGYEGAIPFPRSSFKVNRLAGSRKMVEKPGFFLSSETRRNPPLSVALLFRLWLVCGSFWKNLRGTNNL
ncbi:hypothetical protein J2X35_001806 [Mesorhizobium sp. BE184]|nr:hypothetical protein [Mesorhizobium sp. BE184]